jgi:hypothetical protein
MSAVLSPGRTVDVPVGINLSFTDEEPPVENPDKDLLIRWVAAIVAILLVCAVIGCIPLFTFYEVKQGNKELLLGIVGALTLAFGGLMGYLYGRSSSQDQVNRVKATAVAAATTDQTAVKP